MQNTYDSYRWDVNERSGLGPIEDSVEKFITVPLSRDNGSNGEFNLYYFVHLARGRRTKRSVLFCAGGPGEIVRTLDRANTYVDFLSKNGYNVVFFHLRGTGFSQILPENEKDRFLRAKFAIDDMEAIRADFLDKNFDTKDAQWEAIVGWSFGTVLAQMYASHPRYGRLAKKLIVISPLSRHMFGSSKDAYDDYYKSMLTIYRRTLDRIYSSKKTELHNEFADLKNKDAVLEELFDFDKGILRRTEQAFGSVQSVIEAYDQLTEELFRKSGLKRFSREFYQSLRDLRTTGANAVDDGGTVEKQRLIGKTLRDGLLGKGSAPAKLPLTEVYGQGSERAYYSFGIQDGVNWVFLRELFGRKRSVDEAIDAIRGELAFKTDVHSIHQGGGKVRIDATDIKAWDPANHPHDLPTLIINGEDDPVTSGGQAEHWLKASSTGPRILIGLPGVGHAISLGSVFSSFGDDLSLLNGAIRVSLPSLKKGAISVTNGIATGLELNDALRMTLIEPEGLNGEVAVHGCGILRHDQSTVYRGNVLNVIALIENRGKGKIEIGPDKWSLLMPAVVGTIEFKPTVIHPKTKTAIFGQLVEGRKNPENEFKVRPMFEDKMEGGLKLLGFNVVDGSTIDLCFQNTGSRPLPRAISQWVMENARSRFRFRVDVPRLKKQEATCVSVVVDGLELDPSELLSIEPPKGLADKQICAWFDNDATDSAPLSLVVWNKDKKRAHRVGKGWKISSPVFSARVTLDSVKIEPNGVKKVAAKVTGIEWASCLNIKPPTHWNPALQLLSFNILTRNSVSLIFRNSGDVPTVSGSRDWNYIVPTVDPNEADLDRALNCLIFSFLVLDPAQFRIPEDNEVLGVLAEKFKRSKLEMKIDHEPKELLDNLYHSPVKRVVAKHETREEIEV